MAIKKETVSNAELVTTVKKCVCDFKSTYDSFCAEDLKERKLALKPGEPSPLDDGKIHDPQRRELCQEEMRKIRASGNDVIDRAITETRNKMMEAPTPEAVAALTALSLVGDALTAEDLNIAYDHYGDNYLSCRALNGLADKSGNQGHKRSHGLTTTLAGLEDLKRTVSGLDLIRAEKGFASVGRIALVVSDLESNWGHYGDDGEADA